MLFDSLYSAAISFVNTDNTAPKINQAPYSHYIKTIEKEIKMKR